jgi:hypothetical protein
MNEIETKYIYYSEDTIEAHESDIIEYFDILPKEPDAFINRYVN